MKIKLLESLPFFPNWLLACGRRPSRNKAENLLAIAFRVIRQPEVDKKNHHDRWLFLLIKYQIFRIWVSK
jgi:hypothetical protein